MATRARFGRLPRSAPSLTSTIVALAQQYQGQRDRNIEDAWKNGGLFEGKKVTDSTFLKHWKERMAGVSKDDPMWDYYNNMIHTYDFEIEESKMGQKYAEEKVSEGEMAAFYRKWAGKMPHDSEGYRRLMTQAAKFKAAAGARRAGSNAQAAAAAYNKAQTNTYNSHEAPYDVARSLIAQYALSRNILDRKDIDDPDYGFSKLTNEAGDNDPARFSALLADMQADPGFSEFMTKEIRKYDPNFSGNFNAQTLVAMANTARNGASIRMNRAQKAGLKGDTDAARKAMGDYSTAATIIHVSLGGKGEESFITQNEFHRGLMDDILAEGSGASPMEKQQALSQYREWLTGAGTQQLMKGMPKGSFQPGSPTFNETATGLLARINGTVSALDGKPAGKTLKDDLYGFSTEDAGTTSDAVKLSETAADNRFLMDNIANGSAIVVRTSGTGKNQKPDAAGTNWTVYDRGAPEVDGNDNLVPVVVPAYTTHIGPDGKTTVGGGSGEVRYNVAVPIRVEQTAYQDPNTGAFTGATKPFPGMDNVIGKQVTIQGPGGQSIPIYGTYQGGRLVWSTVNPLKNVDDPLSGPAKTTDPATGAVIYTYSAHRPPTETPLAKGETKPTSLNYNPSDYVNKGALMSPTTKPDWNPANDKQTAWDSPLAALANSSSEHMKFTAGMGTDAIGAAEKEWYSDPKHWTPKMTSDYNTAIQGGVKPQDAMKNVVASKSSELITTVQFNLNYGYTPEQQSATRAAMTLRAQSEAAARAGQTLSQYRASEAAASENAARTDLISKLSNWNVGTEQAKIPGMYVMGMGGASYVPGTSGQKPSQLPKGWSAGELLTQPGMSLSAANNLAYRISKGAVGSASGPEEMEGGIRISGPNMFGFSGVIGQTPKPAPYMPKPGQGPQYGPPAPGSPQYNAGATTPTYVKPKPVAPKPAAPTPQVNAQTGFTVNKATPSLSSYGPRKEIRDKSGNLIGVREGGRTMM